MILAVIQDTVPGRRLAAKTGVYDLFVGDLGIISSPTQVGLNPNTGSKPTNQPIYYMMFHRYSYIQLSGGTNECCNGIRPSDLQGSELESIRGPA